MAFVKKLFEDLDFTQPRPISRLFLNDPVDFGVSEADVPGITKIEKLSKEFIRFALGPIRIFIRCDSIPKDKQLPF